MPADEVHRGTDAARSRARTGPRHAAPKKPLLTRLQMPAGKAIALAAMPTAVLMGMGLTPQLAQAKPGIPKNPFRDGPCVTAPDEQSKATEDAERDAKEKAAKKAEEKAEAARKKADEAKKKADRAEDSEDSEDSDDSKASERSETSEGSKDEGGPRSKPSGGTYGDSGKHENAEDAKDGKADEADEAAEDKDSDEDSAKEPAPAGTRNPLDPLGVGDAIKDVLTPDEKESARPGAPKSQADTDDEADNSKDSTNAQDSDDSDNSKGKVTDKVTKPVDDTLGKVKDGLKDGLKDATDKAVDKAEEAAEKAEKAEKAAEKAKDEADPGSDSDSDAEDSENSEDAKDPMAPDEDGKKPFPCVVEKKVDGDDEQSPAPIPNQPWHLEASSLLLKGADYKGVVNLKMPDGRTKQALKYIISGGTDIGDLHQIVDGPGGKKYHVEAAKGSMSTIRNGDTTMYTERISGNLFGLIPITFDPEHPPPLNLPLIYFTNVKVQQAGQFGGDLTIPGLHQSITD
ncbi:alanine-zipper protein [Streptomyces aureocirculatus]|uniref:alanine-zipper protein n=1 Tax=Streptomyces aureocirculatus TaxID=67275 RepID=UPI0004C9CB97|nr:alanine-zipper protein [Streptomyces aureocirculatus]